MSVEDIASQSSVVFSIRHDWREQKFSGFMFS